MRTPDVFDPLVELAGLWTTELAERHLPIDGMPPATYDCLNGNLIMSPRGGSGNAYAAGELYSLLRTQAETELVAYGRLNVRLDVQSWIETDLNILRRPVRQCTWVPIELVLMSIEFVSRWSRLDKPVFCAAAGVPYFLRVEISHAEVHVELLRLDDSGEYVVHAKALAGQEFRTDLPFPLSFDPAELLEPVGE